MSDVRDPDDPYEQDLAEGGVVPPDRLQGANQYGTTADEQEAPEPLDEFVKREEPETWPGRPPADPSIPAEESALHLEEP